MSVSDGWNCFRNARVGVRNVVGVKKFLPLCCASRALCTTLQCRHNWKGIENNVLAVQGKLNTVSS
jgi:hypothetical protein